MNTRIPTRANNPSRLGLLFLFIFTLTFPLQILGTRLVQAHCHRDSDCPLGDICREGSCDPVACEPQNNGSECPNAHNACLHLSCEKDPGNVDLGGYYCYENRVEGAGCAFDSDCGAQQTCNVSTCQCETIPPPAPACLDSNCDDQDPCTTDACDTNTGQCLHTKIENCPAPVTTDTPRAEGKPASNPCLSSLSAEGVDEESASRLLAQGICSLSLEGQTSRACGLVLGPPPSPWPLLLSVLGGMSLLAYRRVS
jgi:hypothetical protein